MFADIPVLLGAVQAGKLRALAIAHPHAQPDRSRGAPTTAKLGMPNVEADPWYGLVAPAAIPEPIASKLHAAAVEALHSPEVKDKLAARGPVAVGNWSEDFRRLRQKRNRSAGARSSPPPARGFK